MDEANQYPSELKLSGCPWCEVKAYSSVPSRASHTHTDEYLLNNRGFWCTKAGWIQNPDLVPRVMNDLNVVWDSMGSDRAASSQSGDLERNSGFSGRPRFRPHTPAPLPRRCAGHQGAGDGKGKEKSGGGVEAEGRKEFGGRATEPRTEAVTYHHRSSAAAAVAG